MVVGVRVSSSIRFRTGLILLSLIDELSGPTKPPLFHLRAVSGGQSMISQPSYLILPKRSIIRECMGGRKEKNAKSHKLLQKGVDRKVLVWYYHNHESGAA